MFKTLRHMTAALACLFVLSPLSSQASSMVTVTFQGGAFDTAPRPPGVIGRPDYLQAGVRYGAFWFEDVGTPEAYEKIPHTHVWGGLNSPAGSRADYPHSWRDGFQGALITIEDGSRFDLVSLDYKIIQRYPVPLTPSQFERLPWSYPLDDVHILATESVEIATSDFVDFESQWTAVPIDDGSELDLGGGLTDPAFPAAGIPMQTLTFSGSDFENLSQIHIGMTGREMAFDNIVLRVLEDGTSIPEPGTATLLLTGLVWVAIRQNHRNLPRSS